MGNEISENAVREGRNSGVEIIESDYSKIPVKYYGAFDVVCSFQVLEHIADVKSFLEKAINLLKKGGKLIINVPNNDSYIKFLDTSFSQFPPHHMGLWNEKSLSNITKFFPIEFVKILKEPLQKYHISGYNCAISKRIFGNHNFLVRVNNKILSYMPHFIYYPFLKYIKGHTILIIFNKI